MNPLITNYFEAESAIVARLKLLVPELNEIYTPFSVADMLEGSQAAPAAHVIYGGDKVAGNEVNRGATRIIDQQWTIILVVRSAGAQLQNTKVIRESAGLLIPKILSALQGWAPVDWMRPLSRTSASPAGYSSSFAYFPFSFDGRIIT